VGPALREAVRRVGPALREIADVVGPARRAGVFGSALAKARAERASHITRIVLVAARLLTTDGEFV